MGQFPLLRGMISYAIIWPMSCIAQEYIEHGTPPHKADWVRAARFSFFGAFLMAPVVTTWMKFTNRYFIKKSIWTAISRAIIEQLTYTPLAMSYFFFGMCALEMKPLQTCSNEVREKLWPTYKVGLVFWPTVQTLNFYFISEKNRVVFVGAASFVWTVFMAHMEAKELDVVKSVKNN